MVSIQKSMFDDEKEARGLSWIDGHKFSDSYVMHLPSKSLCLN